jgi:hypothetical protein
MKSEFSSFCATFIHWIPMLFYNPMLISYMYSTQFTLGELNDNITAAPWIFRLPAKIQILGKNMLINIKKSWQNNAIKKPRLTSFLRHHSVHSWSWRKWMFVSTSRVSRTVRVWRVTVRSSTGNDMEASGVISFECSSDLSATQRWCSFWTLKNQKHKIYSIFMEVPASWLQNQLFISLRGTYCLEL